jgi:quercetin dioxygenase-like cupin family protein
MMMIDASLFCNTKIYQDFILNYMRNHNKASSDIEGMETNDIFFEKRFIDNGPDKKPIVSAENYKIMRLCLKKGVVVSPHEGDHTAFFLVLEGKGIFTKGTDNIELGQNEYLFFKKDDIRGIKSLEDLVILAVRD